jgi:hypothetical protein
LIGVATIDLTNPDWSVAVGMSWFGALYNSTVKSWVKQFKNVGAVLSEENKFTIFKILNTYTCNIKNS